MNINIAAVDVNTYTIYDFLRDDETEEELLCRANKKKEMNIKNYKELINDGSHTDFYEKILRQEMNKEYKIMDFDTCLINKKKHMLKDEIKEVTAEIYNAQLSELPPLNYCTINGVEMFCMSEMYDATFTTQYARYKGKYYSKMVDAMDKNTWIYHFLLEKENEKNG